VLTVHQLAAAILALLALGTDVRTPTPEELIAFLSPSTQTITVSVGDDLQAVLDGAHDGATVRLPAGQAFTGNYILRRSVTLTSTSLLPERRVEPGDALAVLASPTTQPALRTAPGVSGVILDGLELVSLVKDGTALEVGDPLATDAALQPSAVRIDRVLVRGHAAGQKRGFSLHGSDITVTRSSITGIAMDGQETQALWIMNGPGPYVIRDNQLEASGVNVLIGGDDPRILGLVPSGILIEGNDISKPLAWRTTPYDVKNLLEVKNGRRVIIRRNRLSGNWVSAQAGPSVLFTPRNQYGRAPWTIVEDILFERNRVTDVASGINILGDDNVGGSQRTQRITMRHNWIETDRLRFGGDGRCLQLGRAPQAIVFEHNTCVTNGGSTVYTYAGGAVLTSPGAVFSHNAFLRNTYGFFGEGGTEGTAALARYYPVAAFTGNVIGGAPNVYPAGTVRPTVTEWRAMLMNGFPVGADGLMAGADRALLP
jgi:hypothetical protein